MCWIVHILILDWQVLCTAMHASVQHRISLYTPKSLHKEKIDRGRELERGGSTVLYGILILGWREKNPHTKHRNREL